MSDLPKEVSVLRNIGKRSRASLAYLGKRGYLRKVQTTLPESRPLPPLDVAVKRGKIERLKDGEVAVIGWQSAPSAGSAALQERLSNDKSPR